MAERSASLAHLRSLLYPPPDLPIHIHVHADRSDLSGTLAPGDRDNGREASHPAGAWYLLALRALELEAAKPGDTLLAPPLLAHHFTPHDFQLRTVREVLGVKKPGAILADEVGLGKTFEAGLILKELQLRGMVRTALVVAPKALLVQWQDALRDLFEEDFVLAEERRFRGFAIEERVICSYGQLVSAFEQVARHPWDCLIADEAHLLANPDSKRRRCVAELPSRRRLLLTATPVQNRVTDLYSLIDLAMPGRLGTLHQFFNTYVADAGTAREVIPARVEELRGIAAEILCRTRRAETDVPFVSRQVETKLVEPSEAEAAVIHEVTRYLRKLYRQSVDVETPSPRSGSPRGAGSRATLANRGAVLREIVALQQSLSSSPQAIGAALRNRAEGHQSERQRLMEMAGHCDAINSAKEAQLTYALLALKDDAVLVFTLRLETARRLREVIAAMGRSVACYTGELDSDERREIVARFTRGDLLTLVATDAGAEGLNLHERCHTIFNYDLHWNPMKMEQRIGRVHRLGQRHTVRVASFAVATTIDEYVLQLLQDKMKLFTSTIGELDSVLSDVQEGELDLEERLLDLWLRSEHGADLEAGMVALGDVVEQARNQFDSAARRTLEVLG